MSSLVLLVGITYPLWGLAISFLVARKLTDKLQHMAFLGRVATASLVVILVFAPLAWGSNGVFFLFIPWWASLVADPKQVIWSSYVIALWSVPVLFAITLLANAHSNHARRDFKRRTDASSK